MSVITTATLFCDTPGCSAIFVGETVEDAEAINWFVVGDTVSCPLCMEAGAEPDVDPTHVVEVPSCFP